ncbi:hypothetical protein V5F59_20130 [Xanthobacter autotrophicus DSM 431]|uniref:hypothetical protein n=1 Tax=Xanthobacter nonsaccharivorans TaxID=3119912 RepID=UPI00372CC943
MDDLYLDRLRELARQMARSGRYCSWRLIQIELRFMRGIPEAGQCFGDAEIRAELDTLCREALRRKGRTSFALSVAAATEPLGGQLARAG